jgi:hypothetical protein
VNYFAGKFDNIGPRKVLVTFQRFFWGFTLDYRINFSAKIHQALLSHFSLLAEFLIGKMLVKDLVNLNPGILFGGA